MVDFEPNKRPLTPEVADDAGASFGVPGSNSPYTHQQGEQLSSTHRREDDKKKEPQQTIHGVDQQHYRDRGGGNSQARLREVGDDESKMRHMADYGSHGDAAMALTALSSGMRDLYRSNSDIRSGFQGFTEQQVATPEHGGSHKLQTKGEGGSMAPSYSEVPLRGAQESLVGGSLDGGESTRQQSRQTSTQPLALQSATMTPSSSSSALNTSTLTVSESTSPNSAQDDLASRDTFITPQEQYAPQAPGERMQSLSHMLEDRLSLASLRAEQGWDKLRSRNDEQQHYQDHHSRLSPPFHPDDSMVHSVRHLTERPRTTPTYSTALQREHDELRQHQWEFLQDGRSIQQQQQQDLQARPQLLQHRQQAHEQQHHREHTPSSIQDGRAPLQWMTQVSPSPTIEPVKPKRKYTKKSSFLHQSMAESRDQTTVADLHFKQQAVSNELLYSDRGLILKTQIPKKGRPISKHSTTSSQSTPTLASLGILPASHHYFTGAASSASSSASSVMSGLIAAASTVGRYPSDSALNSHHASSPQGAYLPSMTEQRGGGSGQGISPTGRRPGRPPSNPSLSHHSHSQSYSSPSSSSMSFPPSSSSHSGQSRPLPTLTAHEFDLNSAPYTDRYSQRQGLDDSSSNRFAMYRNRSPTLSVATTASSSQPLSYRHQHQYSDQLQKRTPSSSSASSHRRYVSSPIDQEPFSGDELEYQQLRGEEEEGDDAGSYPGQRRRTVDNPSSSIATTTTMPPRLFGEGVPTQMNTLKRSSSGMQKSLSMDGYHSRPMENRRRMSVGSGGLGVNSMTGRGRRGSMSGYGYDTTAAAAADGQFEGVNEEVGSSSSKFYDDEEVFDDDEVDAQRSRKRVSGSDLDYSGVVDAGAGGSVRRRVGHVSQVGHSSSSNNSKTWHGGALGSERRRPRSLVLPRGRGEPALLWPTPTMQDSGSALGSGGSESMVGVQPGGGGQHQLDIDDDEIDYREMMIMTPAIAPIPQPPPPAVSSSTSSRGATMMMRGASTRDKSRGGRSMHSHARSLDISFTTAASNRGPGGDSHLGHHHHRAPLPSPSSLEHHLSQHDIYSSDDILPERGSMLLSYSSSLSNRRRGYGFSSSGSLISPPFDDTFLSAGSSQGLFNQGHRSSSSSGYNTFDTPIATSAVVTRADLLAREMSGMSSGGVIAPSVSSSERGRGRRGASHGRGRGHGHGRGRGHLKAAVVKRSVSKRGRGPHLKKHQILQQQLYQMQRDQEEMDIQMAMQLQRQQMEKEKKKGKEKEQRQVKLQGRERETLPEQQRQPPTANLRHQHSQSLQLDQEFAPYALQLAQQSQPHSQHQQQQQNQPQTGRPTKQRVLLRSESALAVLHSLHSPPLRPSSSSSKLSQSQSQPALPLSSSNTPTLGSASTSTATTTTQQTQTTSRRRQNQQQPILLRPVSLPSLTGIGHPSHGTSHGHNSGGGSGLDSGASPPYMMNHPPPGQPLFRSLHPCLVSPSSLVSVASNASSGSTSTGTTGTTVSLTNTVGRGRRGKGGGVGRGGEEEEEDDGGNGEEEEDDYGEEDFSSVIKSPHISYASSATPPLVGSQRVFSPSYTGSHRDGHGGFSMHDQQFSQGHPPIHHHHPYQRPHQHSVNTSSTSIHQQHQDQKRAPHPGATMSRSSSRGGLSASSSGTTLVHSFTSQASLHQHQHQHQHEHQHEHQQHRHSSSLPSLNYYQQHQGMGMGLSSSTTSLSTTTSISSLSTSPQHPLDSSQKQYNQQQQQQQQKMSNPSLPAYPHAHAQQNDPTRPPIHRMISHDVLPPLGLPHKQSSTSSSSPHNTTYTTATLTPSAPQQPQSQPPPHEESVEQLMIRTPLGEVRRQEE